MNNNNKKALLLDGIGNDSITTALSINNYCMISKILKSSVNNWEKICEILTNPNIIVIGKFTESIILKMCSPDYEEITAKFLKLLKSRKHIIFMYKDNMNGILNFFHNDIDKCTNGYEINDRNLQYSTSLSSWLNIRNINLSKEEFSSRIKNIINQIIDELNVVSYKKILDINIAGQNFIENIAEGLLIKIAVPNERLWSNEFDKFITLFRDYVSFSAKEDLKIVQNRTNTGVLYSIYSNNENIHISDIDALLKHFSSFMDICISSPASAKNIIDNLDLNSEDKSKIFKKYLKEAQRLAIDIKQERESKILSIKHRLEIDLHEYELSSIPQEYIENSLPHPCISNCLSSQPMRNNPININSSVINKVDNIIYNEIKGISSATKEDIMLTHYFEQLSENISELVSLQTALYELGDQSSSKEDKRNSGHKLCSFLAKVGNKIADTGFDLLTKYIEQKMGF